MTIFSSLSKGIQICTACSLDNYYQKRVEEICSTYEMQVSYVQNKCIQFGFQNIGNLNNFPQKIIDYFIWRDFFSSLFFAWLKHASTDLTGCIRSPLLKAISTSWLWEWQIRFPSYDDLCNSIRFYKTPPIIRQ